MKPHVMLLGCLLLLVQTAAGAAAAEPLARGAPSCGEWVAHREKSDTLALGNGYWLLGYLSGIAVSGGKDFLAGTDNSALNAWIDKYCQANPLKDLVSGGNALAAELQKNKRAAK